MFTQSYFEKLVLPTISILTRRTLRNACYLQLQILQPRTLRNAIRPQFQFLHQRTLKIVPINSFV